MKSAILALVALLVVTAPSFSHPQKRIIGYHKPVRRECQVVHANMDYLAPRTITGQKTSTKVCASNKLPLGTKVYLTYYVHHRGRKVRKTKCWIVADRPRDGHKGTTVEPYIRSADLSHFLQNFEGKRVVTIIKPIYG